jgi:biotin synthase
MLDLIAQSAARHPGHVAIHLIVGLGETERELIERIVWAHTMGIEVGLFAFTPVRGTPLADRSQPPLAQYRRMQAARWLVVNHRARMDDFAFDELGTLAAIELPGWRGLLAGGDAFRTSGCPDCNRPFYNERPGGTTYNYARPLSPAEASRALPEMELSDLDLGAL